MLPIPEDERKDFDPDLSQNAYAILEAVGKARMSQEALLASLIRWSDRQLFTIYAILNIILWFGFTDAGVIVVQENGKWDINHKLLGPFIENPQTIYVPRTHISKLILQYWGGGAIGKAFHDRDAHQGYFEFLQKLGLLECERVKPGHQARRSPISGKWRSPISRFWNIDIPGCLMLMHAIHHILVQRGVEMELENPLDVFPSHRGYSTVFMFNAVFGYFQKWERKELDAGDKIDIPAVICRVIRTTYKRLEHIIKQFPVSIESGWLRNIPAPPRPRMVSDPVATG